MIHVHSIKFYKIFHISYRCFFTKKSEIYQKCCTILGVELTTDQNTVRKTYIELVKRYHPDSGNVEASKERFQQIDKAFKLLQERFAKNRRGIDDDDKLIDAKVFDIKHTAPQHRQYLSFDGIGIGTPFQRQKQYQQAKAMLAQERVLEHRIEKEKAKASDGSLIQKGSFYKDHAIKTKYGYERIVEDLIQEAISKGDFNNLPGSGKPLNTSQTQNPYVDFTTHKLNKILIDNGFTPEWITLNKTILSDIKELKDSLLKERKKFSKLPLNNDELNDWRIIENRYIDKCKNINKSIDKFNLIVPLINKQKFRLNFQHLVDDILKNGDFVVTNPNERKFNDCKQLNKNDNGRDIFSFFISMF